MRCHRRRRESLAPFSRVMKEGGKVVTGWKKGWRLRRNARERGGQTGAEDSATGRTPHEICGRSVAAAGFRRGRYHRMIPPRTRARAHCDWSLQVPAHAADPNLFAARVGPCISKNRRDAVPRAGYCAGNRRLSICCRERQPACLVGPGALSENESRGGHAHSSPAPGPTSGALRGGQQTDSPTDRLRRH